MKESMKDLDGQLADALRREEPSAGFTDRVLDRVAEQARNAHTWGPPSGGPVRPKPDPTFVQWAAAAALVAAMAGGFDYVAKQKERADGEAAKDRLVLGLHIAGAKLQLVQTKINELNEP